MGGGRQLNRVGDILATFIPRLRIRPQRRLAKFKLVMKKKNYNEKKVVQADDTKCNSDKCITTT